MFSVTSTTTSPIVCHIDVSGLEDNNLYMWAKLYKSEIKTKLKYSLTTFTVNTGLYMCYISRTCSTSALVQCISL